MPIRLGYLIGQYPAINHYYLLAEIQVLREQGLEVEVASIAPPDRPWAQLRPIEQNEAKRTWCVKATPPAQIALGLLSMILRRPASVWRGLRAAWRLGAGSLSRRLRHGAYLAEALLIGQWMERERLTHLHVSFSGTVGLLVSRCFPVSTSLGVYGFGELYDPAGSHLREKVAASRFVRAISFHSRNELMLACDRQDWGKLVPVHLGIEPEAFPARPFPAAGGPLRLISVGRLSSEKGQFILLAALRRLLAQQPGAARLWFVGDGPDRAALEAEVRSQGLAGAVTFEGRAPQERLMELYHQADVFVLTSLSEGTPLVLMEAMSMEIPCVAPRLTGIPEVIADGEQGLLYAPASEEDLTAALLRLAGDEALRRRLGQAARRKVLAEFDVRRNAVEFAGVLRRWLPQ
jgi:colanic acid/amylovoran biosynthesis glycosyltransferase